MLLECVWIGRFDEHGDLVGEDFGVESRRVCVVEDHDGLFGLLSSARACERDGGVAAHFRRHLRLLDDFRAWANREGEGELDVGAQQGDGGGFLVGFGNGTHADDGDPALVGSLGEPHAAIGVDAETIGAAQFDDALVVLAVRGRFGDGREPAAEYSHGAVGAVAVDGMHAVLVEIRREGVADVLEDLVGVLSVRIGEHVVVVAVQAALVGAIPSGADFAKRMRERLIGRWSAVGVVVQRRACGDDVQGQVGAGAVDDLVERVLACGEELFQFGFREVLVVASVDFPYSCPPSAAGFDEAVAVVAHEGDEVGHRGARGSRRDPASERRDECERGAGDRGGGGKADDEKSDPCERFGALGDECCDPGFERWGNHGSMMREAPGWRVRVRSSRAREKGWGWRWRGRRNHTAIKVSMCMQ